MLTAVSWHGGLDREATAKTEQLLWNATVAYASARTLNGIISVAQGTEIALQPAGIGVNISAGQILDPLNDLIERFSGFIMFAMVSLGAQVLLNEVFSNFWVNLALTIAASAYLVHLWWPQKFPQLKLFAQISSVLIFVRFVTVAVMLVTAFVNEAFLQERQDEAMTKLTTTSDEIEVMQDRASQHESWFDALKDRLDVEAQLDRLSLRIESAIGHLVDLFVIFTVQTLLLPLGTLFTAYWSFRAYWRHLSPLKK